MEHTKEPWHSHDKFIHTQFTSTEGLAQHYAVADVLEHSTIDYETMLANARRIVACVNACAGIPTEALEGGVVAELGGVAGAVLGWFDSRPSPGMGEWMINARAAIAKAEPEGS